MERLGDWDEMREFVRNSTAGLFVCNKKESVLWSSYIRGSDEVQCFGMFFCPILDVHGEKKASYRNENFQNMFLICFPWGLFGL